MEIVHLENDTYQVIDGEGTVLYQGTYDDCVCYEEDYYYTQFLNIGGF